MVGRTNALAGEPGKFKSVELAVKTLAIYAFGAAVVMLVDVAPGTDGAELDPVEASTRAEPTPDGISAFEYFPDGDQVNISGVQFSIAQF